MNERFALVNLNKPHDVAIVCQMALAFGSEIFIIGTTLDPTHSKVMHKIMSWNIKADSMSKIKWERVDCLSKLSERGLRLLATTPHEGNDFFTYKPHDNDVYVLGGAAGLSKVSFEACDERIVIPCDPAVPFLTVSGVVPLVLGRLASMNQ